VDAFFDLPGHRACISFAADEMFDGYGHIKLRVLRLINFGKTSLPYEVGFGI
jgi:hypothetical protein